MIRVVIPFYTEFEAAKECLRSMREAGMEFDVAAAQGVYIYGARNRGVNGGMNQKRVQAPLPGYSHFLFMDSDTSGTADHVQGLLDLKVPVAACPYLCHAPKDTYQTGEITLIGQVASQDSAKTKGVKARSFVGGGFLLVEAMVFQHLAYPWFHHRMVERYDFREQCGEDVGFCLALREAGYKILVDFDHPVAHRLRSVEQFDLSY